MLLFIVFVIIIDDDLSIDEYQIDNCNYMQILQWNLKKISLKSFQNFQLSILDRNDHYEGTIMIIREL